jgi:enamine deaminase RidA (YjgF/YER057c/UK114 family)
MAHEYIQPPQLFESQRFGYTQVVVASPGKQIFVSGQTALDGGFQLQGGDDLGAQAAQALSNVRDALAAAGATPADVTSLRLYVIDYEPAQAADLAGPLRDFLGDSPPPAQTLIGVQALGVPGIKIEIEATAILT